MHRFAMRSVRYVEEKELAALAKKHRLASGMTKAAVAKDIGVKPPSVHHAEESPQLPYTKLRRRMIEKYSNMKVTGPLFRIEPSD